MVVIVNLWDLLRFVGFYKNDAKTKTTRWKRVVQKGHVRFTYLLIINSCSLLYDYNYNILQYMGVSKNRGTPKSSILIGFSIINHPFWDTLIFGNTYILPIKLFVLLIIPSLNPLLLLYDDNHTFQQKKTSSRWWCQTFLIFIPILLDMIQFDYIIFFQMGGSTTN